MRNVAHRQRDRAARWPLASRRSLPRNGSVSSVRLGDGTEVDADVVIVGNRFDPDNRVVGRLRARSRRRRHLRRKRWLPLVAADVYSPSATCAAGQTRGTTRRCVSNTGQMLSSSRSLLPRTFSLPMAKESFTRLSRSYGPINTGHRIQIAGRQAPTTAPTSSPVQSSSVRLWLRIAGTIR